jgi:tetratricopeptide (TPR) repeat protein
MPIDTISCGSPDFYEVYIDINDEHLKAGSIYIKLDPKVDEDVYKRVPQWLRYRRKDPNNPVLMRAIASYLVGVGEYEEALAEAKELLDAVPGWYMAHNLVGYILSKMGRHDEVDKYFKKVVSLKPNHYIGYYNLACAAALRSDLKECLRYAKDIIDDEDRLESYIYRPYDLFATDSDFDAIRSDETYSKEFEKIVSRIDRFRKQFFAEAKQTRSNT